MSRSASFGNFLGDFMAALLRISLCFCVLFSSYALSSQEATFYDHVEWAKQSTNKIHNSSDLLNLSDYCPDEEPNCEANINNPPEAGMSDADIKNQSTAEY